ncbi:MAG TPA: hypothetical protein VJ965_09435 [Anaerolineales bacterium]|nr:hypothetical protein [Anaerolineales bacterium]
MMKSSMDLEALKKRWDYRVARWVSNILNPPLVAAFGIFLMAAVLGTPEAWFWAVVFVFLAVSIPTSYVVWLLKKGRIENFHIPNRENRHGPYKVIILSNLLGVVLMVIFDAPFLLLAFGVIGMMQSFLLYMVNRYWKISGHTTAITGLSVFMVASLGWGMSPVLVMVPLVAWARIRTRSHSFWQTIAGILTGTTFILATWYLFRLVVRSEF